jgi:hypothetical protein
VTKKHKKQHFVPVCYLKPWCDPAVPKGHEPYVWVFDRDGSNPRRKAPDNIFHETDMYTIEVPGKGRSLVLERGLHELEDRFTRIRNSKINFGRPLDEAEHVLLCAFIAAAQFRTRASREHHRKQWDRPRRMMEEMMERAKTATPEQKKRMTSIAPPRSAGEPDRSLSYENVKALHENPLQHMMGPMLRALTPMLCKLDILVLETDDKIGFITSDSPCVWHDAEAYKRPPMYQGPALMYESIEISLPLSPRHSVVLNRRGFSGYISATAQMIDEMNRRTRFAADEHFVVRVNQTNLTWFDPGVEPEDSWEKVRAREEVASK